MFNIYFVWLATSLKQSQGPLMDKLKTAVKKEEDLKIKLREQAVKFEMFQVCNMKPS